MAAKSLRRNGFVSQKRCAGGTCAGGSDDDVELGAALGAFPAVEAGDPGGVAAALEERGLLLRAIATSAAI